MTFTVIIENTLRGCAERNAPICDQSVPGSPFLLTSPAPREPGYEASTGRATTSIFITCRSKALHPSQSCPSNCCEKVQ